MNEAARRVLAGAIAGAVATFAHTAVMLGSRRALGQTAGRERVPPKQITSSAARRFGFRSAEHEPALNAATSVAHFSFGAAAGALYAPIGAKAGRHSLAAGVAYGLVVWAGSYLGWLPALDLARPATREPAERNAMMIAAHVAWGAALGAVFRGLAASGPAAQPVASLLSANAARKPATVTSPARSWVS